MTIPSTQVSPNEPKLSAARGGRACASEKTDHRRAQAPPDSVRPMAWTVNDACRQLSISRSTIYSLVRARKLKLIKISGRALVPDSEVARLANEGSAP